MLPGEVQTRHPVATRCDRLAPAPRSGGGGAKPDRSAPGEISLPVDRPRAPRPDAATGETNAAGMAPPGTDHPGTDLSRNNPAPDGGIVEGRTPTESGREATNIRPTPRVRPSLVRAQAGGSACITCEGMMDAKRDLPRIRYRPSARKTLRHRYDRSATAHGWAACDRARWIARPVSKPTAKVRTVLASPAADAANNRAIQPANPVLPV